jgi:broad specificity phosphatase PhoE
MNEHIGGVNGVGYGSPNFTDVFVDQNNIFEAAATGNKFYDSPLSEAGVQQAKELCRSIDHSSLLEMNDQENNSSVDKNKLDPSIVRFIEAELDLVVVSPLTRALQTLDIGLYPHLAKREVMPMVVATPKVAERIYLISDNGKTRTELKQVFPYVDFDTAFDSTQSYDDPWHYVPTHEDINEYVEWRPHGEGQVYACLGEPQHIFDKRMSEFHRWLNDRPEQSIAVVCHAGVIEWFTQRIFGNCEMQLWHFDELTPTNLMVADEMECVIEK